MGRLHRSGESALKLKHGKTRESMNLSGIHLSFFTTPANLLGLLHKMRRRPKVALLVETSNSYARELLHGVRAYLRENKSWSIYLGEHGRGDAPPSFLRHWRGDGVIVRIETAEIAAAVAASGLPAVDVSAARFLPHLPWLETDDVAVAKAAAEHFLQRGFKHFAFCGDSRASSSSKWLPTKPAAPVTRTHDAISPACRTALRCTPCRPGRVP